MGLPLKESVSLFYWLLLFMVPKLFGADKSVCHLRMKKRAKIPHQEPTKLMTCCQQSLQLRHPTKLGQDFETFLIPKNKPNSSQRSWLLLGPLKGPMIIVLSQYIKIMMPLLLQEKQVLQVEQESMEDLN